MCTLSYLNGNFSTWCGQCVSYNKEIICGQCYGKGGDIYCFQLFSFVHNIKS